MPDIFSFNDAVRVAANKYINASAAGSAVSGGVTSGSALAIATGGVLPIGGSDGTTARMLAVDANGFASVKTSGTNTTGVTGATTGLMIGGWDGTNYRHFKVDASGTGYVVATGNLTTGVSGVTANGFMVGGSDGTNYRHFSTDTSGRLILTAAANGNAAGAATDVGFRLLGFDGANHRLIATNASGQLILSGLNTNGSANGTAVILVGGTDGTNARTLKTDTSGNVAIYETRRTVFQNETTTNLAGAATFTGTARDAGVAANSSYWATYFNAFFLANQTGTAYIEASNDNTTWYTVATAPLALSVPLTLQVPVMTRYHRVKLVNGATAQTSVFVNSSYTAS